VHKALYGSEKSNPVETAIRFGIWNAGSEGVRLGCVTKKKGLEALTRGPGLLVTRKEGREGGARTGREWEWASADWAIRARAGVSFSFFFYFFYFIFQSFLLKRIFNAIKF